MASPAELLSATEAELKDQVAEVNNYRPSAVRKRRGG